ncbi:RCC1 domain-containing protein [Paludibaculum fermentans]|uniref:RCC1 domain-containing protein n=1 Tax=Paludibaculum fermentans TaxID=1473598 RepID=UPI003EC0A93D
MTFRRIFLFLAPALLLFADQGPRSVVKITGELHKLVLFSDGTVGGWGDMRDGQLGPRAGLPNYRGHMTAFAAIALPEKAIDIAVGDRSSYVLLASGKVLAFGLGMNGELGRGAAGLPGSEVPEEVTGLQDVAQIAASGMTAFAVHKDGTVSAWGSRGSGKLGDGVFNARWGESTPAAQTPVRLPNVAGVVQVSCGAQHVLALTAAGKVLSWGGAGAKLGRTLPEGVRIALPEEIPGLENVASVAATAVASAALKKDGTVWVWGSNQQAEFGNGRREDDERTWKPVRVPAVMNGKALVNGLIGRHLLVLLKDGTVKSWGNSDWGQAGNGLTGEEQATPALVKISGVKAVFAGGNQSFAVKQDGTAWVWGSGDRREWPLAANAPLPVALSFPVH